MFIIVDLPEPDGPMMATYSPSAMSRLTPSSAWTFSVPTSYVRWRLRIAISTRASALRHLLAHRLRLHLLIRLELAQRLVRTGHHQLARLQLTGHLDHGLARKARAHRHELRRALAHHEHSGD